MAFSKPGDFHLEDFLLHVPVIDKSSLSQYCIFLLGLGKTPWYSDAAHLFTTFKKPFNLMHFLKGKRTNIFIDDYCRPAKVFSWHFSMICSFYTFMEKGVGFFIPVYPLVFHHKKSLILTFYCFCQDGILRFHHKS